MSTCPRCGQQGLPIVYGNPTLDAVEQAQRGELILAGCLVQAGAPTHACQRCQHEWGRLQLSTWDQVDAPWDDLEDEETDRSQE